jgi:hypothetical protein
MLRTILLLCLIFVCNEAMAQNYSLPKLNPGEVLIAIDGVPVNQSQRRQTGIQYTGFQDTTGVERYVVNRDPVAYNHAVREAQILANRGTAGHPLGCAPGCSKSGTGYSWSPRPNHCFYGELSDNRLVARACVKGRNGAYFWSAHYR